MLSQPDDTTCGPTCLHAVYQYFGDDISLDQVIAEVPRLEHGGTLEALLGCHALQRGYRVTIHTCNLKVFDPTWFKPTRQVDLVGKLEAQARAKRSSRLGTACRGYVEFLRLGGTIRFEVLTGALMRSYLNRDLPILTGLSSTYLYQTMREYGPEDDEDDVRGYPAGHFVVLCGYNRKHRRVSIADPLHSNPHSASRRYEIDLYHVLSSILLGVLTYDGNLLIIEPPLPGTSQPDANASSAATSLDGDSCEMGSEANASRTHRDSAKNHSHSNHRHPTHGPLARSRPTSDHASPCNASAEPALL